MPKFAAEPKQYLISILITILISNIILREKDIWSYLSDQSVWTKGFLQTTTTKLEFIRIGGGLV